MKKIKKIFIFITISALAAAAVLSVLLFLNIKEKNKFENMIYERTYSYAAKASEELLTSLAAAHTDFLPSDISDVKRYAEEAFTRISELPLDTEKISRLSRYYSLVGDVAQKSLELLDSGEKSEYYKNLFGTFSKYANKIAKDFLPSLKGEFGEILGTKNSYTILDGILSGLGEIYYDGLYSDMERSETFLLLKNAPIWQKEEAAELAKSVFGKNISLSYELKHTFPPVYTFSCGNASLDISQMGGYIIRMLFDHRATSAEITLEEAKEKSNEFVKAQKIPSPELVSFEEENDAYTFIYAPSFQNNTESVLLLSEKITVCVSKESCKICAFDAENYYKYHNPERKIPTLIGEKKAKEISGGGENATFRLVYIVSSDGKEKLCYETENGTYINAENGRWEIKSKIF